MSPGSVPQDINIIIFIDYKILIPPGSEDIFTTGYHSISLAQLLTLHEEVPGFNSR